LAEPVRTESALSRTRLEKAIANWKPTRIKTDPTTNFWTVYKKVADEHDNDLVSKYVGDLDTSLLFVSAFTSLARPIRLNQTLFVFQAGLFSAVTSAFIVQIVPELQPDPTDLTNVLLLRILQQNTSFNGINPLTPVSSIPTGVVKAQSILFASLSVTLFVAFIAVLGKQWILYYTRVTTWGNIADRGKEHQVKLVGLQKWGLHLIMESLPVMLQLALLLFGVALSVYLWDLNVSIAQAVLVVTTIGLTFYISITLFAATFSDCPFQTPFSILLPKVPLLWKELAAIARVRSWRSISRVISSLRSYIERVVERGFLRSSIDCILRTPTSGTNTPNHVVEDISRNDYPMTLSNPTFWRTSPLFASPIRKDIAASAGFWLLENSTDFSAASAVAAVFSELQWPSHYRSTTALIRLRDTYMECFRAPEFKKSTRLKALQSAAAYYVLYHTQLIWSTSNSLEVEVGGLTPDLPPDLLLHLHSDKWEGDDVFEHLLRTEDRTESVTSARFLSYLAPYWFCGDSDSAIRFRPSRLQTLYELIEVLENNRAFNPVTLTDCLLCAGAAMDFPLHPEDLIRTDKRCVPLPCMLTVALIGDSDYVGPTFKLVVEHVHGLILARGRRRRHTKTALEIILTLVRKTTLSLVDASWINGLLKSASRGNMGDDTFTLFLRLSARRKEEDATVDVESPAVQDWTHVHPGEMDPQSPRTIVSPEIITPESSLFIKILQNVQNCGEKDNGWQDEAVYGGLIAMKDIPRLGSFFPDSNSLGTLFKAMEKTQPFRVRKAAYDVILVAREGWLRSADLRPVLEDLDFPKQLHSVVIETGRSDHQRSFLMMMEILSEDRYWHPYLRGAMDIWLPFRHEGPDQVIRILTRVGELPLREYDGSPLDKFLEQLVENEWAAVPGRALMDLTADRLEPLVEITTQFKELLFTEIDRKVVLAVVELVVPGLEKRREDGYEGPGEDIREMVEALIGFLQIPIQSTSRRSTYW